MRYAYHIATSETMNKILRSGYFKGAINEYPWSIGKGGRKVRALSISFTTNPKTISEVMHTFGGDDEGYKAIRFDFSYLKRNGARPVKYKENPRGFFEEQPEWDIEEEWRIKGKRRVLLPRKFKVCDIADGRLHC